MIAIVAAALFALAAKQEMVVSSEWLNAHLNDPLVTIVEVGDRGDYDAGHIPGARFVRYPLSVIRYPLSVLRIICDPT